MDEYDKIFSDHFGVGILRGFQGEVQFNRKGKPVSKAEANRLLTNYSRFLSKAKNEATLNGVKAIVQTLDPSGVSNYPDTYKTLKSDAPIQEKAFAVLGSLPMLGEVKGSSLKLSKGTLKGEKALNGVQKLSKALDKVTPRTKLDPMFEGLTQKVYNKIGNPSRGFYDASKISKEDKLNLLFSGSNVLNKTGDLLNAKEAAVSLYDSYILGEQMNKNKKKFAYGGTAMDIDSPEQDLSQIQRFRDDVLAESSNNPLVAGLRGMGGMLIEKGYSMSGGLNSLFAMGGTVRTKSSEVEGEEVAEFPNGVVGEFEGPSHSEGGIPVDLPIGTDIYSKRIKVNGETMADRKLIREKQLNKFEKLFDKNPLDKNLQRTLDRIKSNNESLDNKDMEIQNSIHELVNPTKRAYGGTIYGDDEEDLYQDDLYNSEDEEDNLLDYQEEDDLEEEDEDYEEEDYFALGGTVGIDPLEDDLEFGDIINKYPTMSNRGMTNSWIDSQELNPINRPNNIQVPNINSTVPYFSDTESSNSTEFSNPLGNFSIGDLIGMGGQLYGAFGARKNTLDNRRGDTPNINPYKDYGKAGLNALSNARQGMEYNRDLSLQDLEASRNTMSARNRNSARGINTLRALNLSTDTSINNTKNKAFADYSNRLNNLSLQEANMLNQRDRMVMQGEGIRDMNDRRDRDAFYTNMGADTQNMSEAIQNLGKNLNKGLERGLTSDALSALSKYFDVDISAKGMSLKNKKGNK